jgi:thioredoxin-dependent peroxiredoxin
VWVEKSMYGKKYLGTERSTFVIGADGTIEAVLEKVSPDAHLALLLEVLA